MYQNPRYNDLVKNASGSFFIFFKVLVFFPHFLSELGKERCINSLKSYLFSFCYNFPVIFAAKIPLRTLVQFIYVPCFYTAVPERSQLALPTLCIEQTQLFMQYTEEEGEREISL